MRILLINYEYPPIGAGAATATQAIARQLVGSGHEVTVLTAGYQELVGTSDDEGVTVIRVKSRRPKLESASIAVMVSYMLHAACRVRGVVRSERIEGIIAFFSIPGGPVALWAHMDSQVPYIISLRGGDVPGAESGLGLINRILSPLRRAILRSARAIVANSPSLKDLSERADPFPVLVIPNGVDTEYFCPRAVERGGGNPARLLFVGRFQGQKNLPWLIDRIAEIKAATEIPIVLDLVGDGPLRSILESQVAKRGLADIVRFHGWLDRAELYRHYREASLVINPSLYEGMPNVLLEAMACGRPVLASRVPGNDAVVVDGVTGWLFQIGDSAEFTRLTILALEKPINSEAMGLAARKRVESEFSWRHAADSYLVLLEAAVPIPHPS